MKVVRLTKKEIYCSIFFLLLGIIVGILVAAPILGWELPDSSATLIGSALGALLAVVGAMYATNLQEADKRKNAMQQIVANLDDMEIDIPARLKELNEDRFTARAKNRKIINTIESFLEVASQTSANLIHLKAEEAKKYSTLVKDAKHARLELIAIANRIEPLPNGDRGIPEQNQNIWLWGNWIATSAEKLADEFRDILYPDP